MTSIPQSSGVYKIICTANGKIYVGSSNNLKRRWLEHKSNLRHNRHHNAYLQNAWNKYGESTFIFEVAELVMPWSITDREDFWLKKLESYLPEIGYNISMVSVAAMTGRNHSAETKEKLSVMKMGHFVSEDTREKLRKAHTGKKLSVEQRAKWSTSSRTAIVWIFTDPEGNEFRVRGLSAFCREHGLLKGSIVNVASGLHHTHHGWKCRKAEDQI